MKVLATIGAFRVVDAHDAAQGGFHDRWHGDLEQLRAQGLIALTPHVLDGQRTALVTLTRAGRALLERHRHPAENEAPQAYYDGLVKPREVSHDAQLARLYVAAAERLQGQGARVSRVLLDYELKREYPCWRGAGRVFHVHHKALYRAIGEPDNRHRRSATVARAIERLMVLDAVLSDRQTAWLATEREKVSHFVQRCGFDSMDLPRLEFVQRGDRTVRYFPHKLPVGIGSPDQIVFVYVVTDPSGRDFRTFLAAHRPLVQRLHRWTIRLVFPAALLAGKVAHGSIANEFVAAPLRPGVLEEFRWFCQTRRAFDEAAGNQPEVDLNRYSSARRAFGAPRFYAAYRAWRERGDAALNELLSPRLHDTWTRGDGRLDIHVLPHQYHHLAPAVATA